MPGRLGCKSRHNQEEYHKIQSFTGRSSNTKEMEPTFVVEPPARLQVGAWVYPFPVVKVSLPRAPKGYFAMLVFLQNEEDRHHDLEMNDRVCFGHERPDDGSSSPEYTFCFPKSKVVAKGTFSMRMDIYELKAAGGPQNSAAELITQVHSREIVVSDEEVEGAGASMSTWAVYNE